MTEPMVRKAGEMVPVGWNEALAAAQRVSMPHDLRVGPVRLRCSAAHVRRTRVPTRGLASRRASSAPTRWTARWPTVSPHHSCSGSRGRRSTRRVQRRPWCCSRAMSVKSCRSSSSGFVEPSSDGKTRIVELSPTATSLTAVHGGPSSDPTGDAPAVARALCADGSGGSGGATSPAIVHPEGPAWAAEDLAAARALLDGQGEGTVIVLGRPSVAEHADVIADAARALAAAWPRAKFLPALRRGNVMGALDMGLAPGVLPGRVALDAGGAWFAAPSAWGSVPMTRASTRWARSDHLRVSGTRPVRIEFGHREPRYGSRGGLPDSALAKMALGAADFVVAVSGHKSAMTDRADVILPVAIETNGRAR